MLAELLSENLQRHGEAQGVCAVLQKAFGKM
jgi:hypothetical protein